MLVSGHLPHFVVARQVDHDDVLAVEEDRGSAGRIDELEGKEAALVVEHVLDPLRPRMRGAETRDEYIPAD